MAEVVAITGATGFIGRTLALHLLENQYKVVALARRPDRALEQLNADAVVRERVLLVNLDGSHHLEAS